MASVSPSVRAFAVLLVVATSVGSLASASHCRRCSVKSTKHKKKIARSVVIVPGPVLPMGSIGDAFAFVQPASGKAAKVASRARKSRVA